MLVGVALFVVHVGFANSMTSTSTMPTTLNPARQLLCLLNNPCLNGGTCREPEDWECSSDPGMGDTVCDCKTGFKGTRCEIKVESTCDGAVCSSNERCVEVDNVNKIFRCINEADTRASTAPHCSPGPHALNYTVDFRDRDKPVVCLNMYYTNTTDYCYDVDSSLEFEIEKEDVKDFFCLKIDYTDWQTCLGINKTFNRDNFPQRPVMDVILSARENDRVVRSASVTFRVTFNIAPSVTHTTRSYNLNMAALGNPHILNIEQDFGVTDEERVEFSLEGSNARLSINSNTGALSVTLQDKDVMAATIKIKDDGIPSLTTRVRVNIEVLTLDCSQTKTTFFVNSDDVGRNIPVGKIQCHSSKGYTPVYTQQNPRTGLELKIEQSTGLVSITRGRGVFSVQFTVSLAGKISIIKNINIVIRETITAVFEMPNEPWNPDYADPSSISFDTLRNKTVTAIQSVFTDPKPTVEILLFREGTVTAYFLLMAEIKNNLETANTNLSRAVQTGRVGGIVVNRTSYQSFKQVGLVQVEQLEYSSPDVSNTPSSTLNNTRVDMTCRGLFLLPVGEVTVEWRITEKNALIVPLSYSRFQTEITSPTPGDYVSTLTANNILFIDSGPVTCSLVDDAGRSASKRQDIRVIAPPIVTLTPIRQALIRMTETIKLTCNITAPRETKTVIVWFRDDVEIGRESTTYISELSVGGSNPQTFTYRCQGENIAGKGDSSDIITVFVTQVETVRCEAENGWPPSASGIKVEAPCPPGESGIQTRQCGSDGNWQADNRSQCVSNNIGDVIGDIQWLADGVQVSNLSSLTGTLAERTSPQILRSKEVSLIADSLDLLLNISRENNITDNKAATVDFTQGFVDTASNILDPETSKQWDELNARPTKVLTQVDSVTEVSADSLSKGQVERIQSANIDLEVGKTNPSNLKDIVFPTKSQRETEATLVSFLHLDSVAVARASDNQSLSFSTIYYKNITAQLPAGPKSNTSDNSTLTINSDTLALNLFPSQKNQLIPPLMLNFSHTNISLRDNKRICAYLNIVTNQWESDGCNVTELHSLYTVCACDHLTNFAILMNPYIQTPSPQALTIITIVGCSISIFCLVLTIIVYVTVWRITKIVARRSHWKQIQSDLRATTVVSHRYVKSDQTAILMNICVVLAVAMLLFVMGVDKTANQIACTVIAVLLHFFYLVTFFMMLVAGLEILWTVVAVFATRSKLKPLLIGGWVLPAVIVGLSMAGTQLKGYGTETFCWLAIEGGLIWAFVAPVLVIVVINFIIIAKLVHILLSTHAMENQDLNVKIRKGLRGVCVLLPILGVSWVFGILAVNEQLIAFQYIFAILNSLQGLFIFISQCCLSKKRDVNLQMRGVKDHDSSAHQNLLQSLAEDPSYAEVANPGFGADGRRLPAGQQYESNRPSGVYDIPDDPLSQAHTYQGHDTTKTASSPYVDMGGTSRQGRAGGNNGNRFGDQQGNVYVNQEQAKEDKGKDKKKDKGKGKAKDKGKTKDADPYRNITGTSQSGVRPPPDGQSRTQLNDAPYANMDEPQDTDGRHRHQPLGKDNSNPYATYNEDFVPYGARGDTGNGSSAQAAFHHPGPKNTAFDDDRDRRRGRPLPNPRR